MAAKKSVELFYDVVSPYSWFAFEVILRYQNRWNINLKLRPFFLGGVMQQAGNRPPAMVPNKGMHLTTDVERCARYYEVPLIIPKNPGELMFEKGSLKAQRFLTVLDMKSPEKVEAVSREFWMRGWSRDEDLSDDTSLAEAANKAGLSQQDIQDCLSRVKDQDVKDRLKNATDEAMELGAFGSPMIVTEVDGKKEWVFGSDRFPILAQILGEKWEGPNPGVASKL